MQKTTSTKAIKNPELDFNQLLTLIRANNNFSQLKDQIRSLSKQSSVFYEKNVQGDTLLSAALDALNVCAVREILFQGVDPNKFLLPDGVNFIRLFPKALKVCQLLRNEKDDGHQRSQTIVELLWVYKALIDQKEPYQPTATYLQAQQQKLDEQYPGLIDFDNPVLGLCYAVHSALRIPGRPGADKGRVLLAKLTRKLDGNCYEAFRLFSEELKRLERKNFWEEYGKVSLSTDHFQTDLLREIGRDQRLMKALNLKAPSQDILDESQQEREAFREQLIRCLDNRVLAVSYIVAKGILPE